LQKINSYKCLGSSVESAGLYQRYKFTW